MNTDLSAVQRPASTLVDVLRLRATVQRDQRAYTFLADGETDERHATYGEIDRRARAIGARLREMGAAGERVLLLCAPGLDYIAAFYGCLYAGAVAVPAYPPNPARLERSLPRLSAIAASARPAVALVEHDTSLAVRLAEADPALSTMRWLSIAACSDDDAERWRDPDVTADTLAFLQYTSGSTAAPKGAMLTHRNLLHNSALIERGFDHSPASHGVIWLPPYHDMGLIGGIIQPLYVGFPVTLMAPVAFLQRPLRWLEAISRYGATTSGGPNFAYELCIRKTTPEQRAQLDLSTWRVAFNGAEPVHAATIERFAGAFAPTGFRREAFYPCYGLAEATLLVSGGRALQPPLIQPFQSDSLAHDQAQPALSDDPGARTLVGCGQPLIGQQVAIVEPQTLQSVAADQVGEIWVSGLSVAQGYWQQPELTAETFAATLPTTGDQRWLRTGDLGFLHDGALFITGRLKDLIIIRGRNHYPQDIELTAERSHPALRPSSGAAFAVEGTGEEQLVIVYEVERQHRRGNLAAVADAVRSAVAREHELQATSVVLIAPGSVPKTSSGKIQRSACRAQFLNGTLDVLIESAVTPEIDEPLTELDRAALVALAPDDRRRQLETFLREQLGRIAQIDVTRLDPQQPVIALGLDSLMAIELQYAAESRLGVTLPMEDLLQGASIAELAEQILPQIEAAPAVDPDQPAAREDALSVGQRSLWFLHQLAPDSRAYTIAVAAQLHGPLDRGALRRAFDRLVERHPALRTTFATIDGTPRAVLQNWTTVALQEQDAAGWDEPTIQTWLDQATSQPFDLQHGPLFRVSLVTRSTAEHILLLTVHHSIADLWSLAVLLDELRQLYPAERRGSALTLRPPRARYADYVQRQTALQDQPEGERLWRYWEQQLAGALPVLDLPTDRPRSPVQTYHGTRQPLRIDAALSRELQALAQANQVTLYVLLLACWQTLLYRYSGQSDILVGSPTTGRDQQSLTDVIGYFVNPIVLRADLGGNPSFATLLTQVQQTVADGLRHQRFPFATLVERLQPVRDPSYAPLFQTMFVWQKAQLLHGDGLTAFALGDADATLSLDDLQLEVQPLSPVGVQFDLTLTLGDAGHGLVGWIEANADLFDAATVARMTGHLDVLLRGIVAHPGARIDRLPLLTEAERNEQLLEWNASAADYPRTSYVPQLFEAQAQRQPDTPAAVLAVPGHMPQELTYAELNARANRLAHALRANGVGPDVCVGLCVERSLEMIVGILGILKAGGAYVPLDPAYPAERIQFMLQDSRAPVLVTQQALRDRLSDMPATVLCFEDDWARRYPADNLPHIGPYERMAYVIYTSGSTGQPKGAMVQNRGLINLVYGLRAFFDDPLVQQVGLITSISFDISVNQIFPTLLFGRTLHIVPDPVKFDPDALLRFIIAHNLHLLDGVPSYYQAALASIPAPIATALRYLLIGGEKLEQQLFETIFGQLGSEVAVVNIYGLTEFTDINALGVIRAADLGQPITAGRPLQNNQLYIVNAADELQPVGITGELCVAGESLSRGYLRRPALTAEKFMPSPYADGAVMGHSGDLARWRPDGRIEIMGRRDAQIKLRGYRIELGEIEAALLSQPGVHESAVVIRADQLVGYVATALPLTAESLQAGLRATMPDYMIPATFVILPTLPKTPSGKIDRRALPAPPETHATAALAAPTPTEALLANVWAEVLGLEQVGIHDNFFQIGGHSLLATQLAARIRDLFQIELPLRAVFEATTVARLAQRIDAERAQAHGLATPPLRAVPHDSPLPLSYAQQRLWMLEQIEPGTGTYLIPAAVRLHGALDVARLQQSLEAIVQRHDVLRTSFTTIAGQPVQQIAPELPLRLTVIDLQARSSAEREAELQRLMVDEARRPFDLTRAPLVRATLVQIAAHEAVLLLTLHHIVADGWSMYVISRELSAFYNTDSSALGSAGTPLPIQYADYAIWQRQWLHGAALQTRLDYWRQQLGDDLPVLELPTDHPRPPVRTFRGARESLLLPTELADALQTLSNQHAATLFMTLLAAFKILLHRQTGLETIVVGTPVAQRSPSEVERLVGLFLNSLVLRTELHADLSFGTLLERVREVCLQAYTYGDLPFEKLLEALQPARTTSHTPLFQVFFNMLNFPDSHSELPGLKMETLIPHEIGAKFDVTLYVEPRPAGIQLDLVYNADLFTAERISDLLAQYELILRQAVAQPAVPIRAISLVTPAAHTRLPDPTMPLDASWPGAIQTALTDHARRTPDQLAVADASERWSYAELDDWSNRLAHALVAQGIQQQDIVAIYAHRSATLVWALLGVLRAGAAFMILDPAYPEARLIDYLEIARPQGWVAIEAAGALPAALAARVAELPAQLVLGRRDQMIAAGALREYPSDPPTIDVRADDLACVGFTSGSTGRPKAVLGRHGPLTHFLPWQCRQFSLSAADRFSMLSGLAHDPLQRDIFTPLWLGATICIPGAHDLGVAGGLSAWMSRESITVAHLTPALSQMLAETLPGAQTTIPSLRRAFIVGDVLTRWDVLRLRRLAPALSATNFYGSTETQRAVSYYVVDDLDAGSAHGQTDVYGQKAILPLGSGMPDVQLLVLNAAGTLAGIGEVGEIYMRSPHLARGYLDDDALTAARFIANPFAEQAAPDDRLYRTGDLGRYLPSGDVEFTARADQQIKIRGFRVEPGEIEALLAQHPSVQDTVVIARSDVADGKTLVAYVVARPGHEIAADVLRSYLSQRLPSYMVPPIMVPLARLPKTPNGKIDRAALPRPAAGRGLSSATATPQNEMERRIVAIWQQVLQVSQIGRDDNFFDLGGNSVHLIQVHSQLQALLGRELPVAEMFNAPTVSALAQALSDKQPEQALFQEIDDRAQRQRAAAERQRRLRMQE